MDGVWSDCAIHNIEHTVYLEDEFTGGDVNSNTVGDLGWAYNAITTNATFSYNDANTAADRPGILHLATTNSSNTGSTMSLATGGNMGWILAANQIFKTSLALSHITNGVVRFGFHDATTGTARPTNGVYFEFNPANNANWEYCSSGGVPCTATTVAPTANTFQRFEIRITAVGAGTSVATFLIDGTSVGTISGATFTANNVAPAYQFFTNTTLVRSLYIDYFQARTVTGAAR